MEVNLFDVELMCELFLIDADDNPQDNGSQMMGQIRCPITGIVINTYFAPPGDNQLPSFFLSHFTEHTVLGSGGYATVVQCTNKFDEQEYAIKKIPIGEVIEDNPESQAFSYASLVREARVWSRLNHQNIVRYYESWTENKYCGLLDEDWDGDPIETENPCLYIQLELCASSLERKLRPNEQCMNNWTTREECAKIFEELVKGLNHIHGKGIMHGDITKANILFCNGEAKISDFGLARTTGAKNDEVDMKAFRPYRAPERKTADADVKADIYSLGILLFEMLQPFTTDSARGVVLTALRDMKIFPKGWTDNPVRTWVLRMINNAASQRPSASDLLLHCERIKTDIRRSEAMPSE